MSTETKSKYQQIKDILLGKNEGVKLASMKLDDGVTMIEATPDFEVGASVVVIVPEDDQKIPVPPNTEGEPYTLEDGRVFTVVEEGIIATIGEAPAATEKPAEEVAATEKPAATPLAKKIIETIAKESHFSKMTDLERTAFELSIVNLFVEDEAEKVELSKDAELVALKAEIELLKNPPAETAEQKAEREKVELAAAEAELIKPTEEGNKINIKYGQGRAKTTHDRVREKMNKNN